MRKTIGTIAALGIVVAAGAAAQDTGSDGSSTSGPISPEEFGAYAEGYTLYFERDGEPWGSESFGADGSVTWRFPTGTCMDGVWSGHQGRVCFYYGEGDEVMCWAMRREDGQLKGRLAQTLPNGDVVEDANALELTITHRDRAPLLCSEEGTAL